MKTLIELYDKNVILNISAAVAYKPDDIIFVCGESVSNKKKAITEALLSKYTPDTRVTFKNVTLSDEDTVKKVFEGILKSYSDCCVELTGGSDMLFYYAGRYLNSVNSFFYRPGSGKATYVSGPFKGKTERFRIALDINDFAFMAGGRYIRHGHFDINSFDGDIYEDAKKVWDIYLNNKEEWHNFVSFLQAVCKEDSASYKGPITIRKKEKITGNIHIFYDLFRAGILKELDVKENNIFFRFKNLTLKELMNDFGIWLEIFIYRSAVESGKFDNAEMSVIFDWNDRKNEIDDVFNEIDVVVTKGVVPLFISCKAGAVTTAALNEIIVLTERFGSDVAKAVLVTTTDLSEVSVKTYKRAMEMGIHVVDLSDLLKRSPADILEEIITHG